MSRGQLWRHVRSKQPGGRAAALALALGAAALVSCGADEESSPEDEEASGEVSADESEDDWLEDLEPMTLRIADWTAGDASTGLYGEAWTGFADRVEDATDGKVTFEFYWGTSLLTATDAMQGIGDGVADISVVNSVYYPSELPVGTWLAGMGADLTGSIVHDVASGGAQSFQTAQTLEPLVEEWEEHNLYPLMTVGSAPYNLICTEPLETLADAEGKIVRTAGGPWTHVIEALGMEPSSLSYNEIYEGLQRGVIDCVAINPNQLVSSLTLQDVAPYYHPVTFPLFQATNFMMTLDRWEELPVELQRIFHEESAQVARDIWDKFIELEARAGEAIASGEVVETVEATELMEAATAAREEYIASLPDTAPPEVDNPEQVVEDYADGLDNWNSILVDQGYEIPERDIDAILESFETLDQTDYTEFFEVFKSEYIEPNAPQ